MHRTILRGFESSATNLTANLTANLVANGLFEGICIETSALKCFESEKTGYYHIEVYFNIIFIMW